MNAVAAVPVCSLKRRPDPRSETVDEMLLGWPGEVLSAPCPGWVRLRTHYRYEGYAPRRELICPGTGAARWLALPRRAVGQAAAGSSLLLLPTT